MKNVAGTTLVAAVLAIWLAAGSCTTAKSSAPPAVAPAAAPSGTAHEPEALHRAAVQGDCSEIRRLLEAGADIEAENEAGLTPLIVAANAGRPDVVSLLIENGVAVDACTKDGFTALMVAAAMGHAEVARLLLLTGADADLQNVYGWTALMNAVWRGNARPARLLIEAGADVDLQAGDGRTALIIAAQGGNSEMMKLLIGAGADINLWDASGCTALKWVMMKGFPEAEHWLRAAGARTQSEELLPAARIPPAFFAPADCSGLGMEIDPDIHQHPRVPERVTYISADPAVCDRTLEKIEDFFLQGRGLESLFGKVVVCGPYLSRYLAANAAFENLKHGKVNMVSPGGGLLQARAFRSVDCVSAFAHYLRNSLNLDGAFVARKLDAWELDWYWSIISWDIREPIFILESPHHTLLLEFHEGEVFFADDFGILD
jgi:ankyrin repeat protein